MFFQNISLRKELHKFESNLVYIETRYQSKKTKKQVVWGCSGRALTYHARELGFGPQYLQTKQTDKYIRKKYFELTLKGQC